MAVFGAHRSTRDFLESWKARKLMLLKRQNDLLQFGTRNRIQPARFFSLLKCRFSQNHLYFAGGFYYHGNLRVPPNATLPENKALLRDHGDK